MKYWNDLFTGTTWQEFQAAGAKVSGFREKLRKNAQRIQPGDILIAYLTGVMRWVGALEVIGPSKDKTHIWAGEDFPVRCKRPANHTRPNRVGQSAPGGARVSA